MNRNTLCVLALTVSCAMGTTGCATSGPVALLSAVGQRRHITADRLMAVAETFEEQQNYGKARELYRLVLQRQPRNSTAGQRVAWIDSLRGGQPSPAPFETSSTQQRYARSAPQPRAHVHVQPPAMPTQAPVLAQSPAVHVQPLVVNSQPEAQVAPRFARPQIDTVRVPAAPQSTANKFDDIQAAPQSTPSAFETVVDRGRVTVEVFAAQAPTYEPASVSQGTAPDKPEWTLPVSTTEQQAVELVDSTNEAAGALATAAGIFEVSSGSDEFNENAIEQFTDYPDLVVPELTEFLAASDPEVRSLAAFLIGETGFKGASALPRMIARLDSEPSEPVRITLAESVAKIDSQSQMALQVLANGLRSSDFEIRSQSAFAMRVFTASSRNECITHLVAALSDSDPRVRSMAALSLGDFGTAAARAVAALESALSDSSADVRDAASAALGRISP